MRMDSLRVLVTGGAGFIGSHLVRELVFRGYEVRVLDNLSRGSLQNIHDVLSSVELIVRDVRDYEAVEKAVRGVDAVVHLAALTDVGESLREPNLYTEVNVVGTLNLARASRRVDSFIYASSSAVYGDPVKIPIPEDHPLHPKSPYGASKASGELYLMSYSKVYGF
ncbi:MAG: SDR family NAD(P)-dependent oxidoreductase, partial [Sulfolobales archaeon]